MTAVKVVVLADDLYQTKESHSWLVRQNQVHMEIIRSERKTEILDANIILHLWCIAAPTAIPIRIRHLTSTSSVVKWLRRLH